MTDTDPLDDFEFAVFWPRIDDLRPHRGPQPGGGGLAWCKAWIKEAEEDGFRPGAFIIRERKINSWRDIDV